MTVVGTLADPGSRTLAGWWRQFADAQPVRIAFGPLPLVQLHALARLRQRLSLTPAQRFLLRALSLSASSSPVQLETILTLPRPLISAQLESLRLLGFVASHQDQWSLTSTGHKAWSNDDEVTALYNRRAFTFMDARPLSAPQFLSVSDSQLSASRSQPLPAEIGDFLTALHAAVEAPVEWKQSHRFPAEIEAILWPTPQEPEANGELIQPTWRRLIIVTTESMPGVMVECADHYDVYALDGEGYSLDEAQPLITLPKPPGSADGLIPVPDQDALFSSWQTWCQARQFPTSETISLRIQAHELLVEANAPLRDRIMALGTDQWLLMDGSRMRLALHIVAV